MPKEKKRILGFRPDGVIAPFVSDDMYSALQELGHDVLVLDTQKIRQEYQAQGIKIWDRYIQLIQDFKPQFSIFYGTCGIILFNDRHADSGHLLSDLKIPIFPCFFDDPGFVLGVQPHFSLPKETFVFVWDKAHLEQMRYDGFKNLAHLPLGTNPKIFSPSKKINGRFDHNLCFVGTLQETSSHLEALKKADVVLQNMFEKAVRRKLDSPAVSFHEILPDLARFLGEEDWSKWKQFETSPDFWKYHNALNHVANNIWREQIVTSIAMNDCSISVYGNEEWSSREVDYQGFIDYHEDLPKLYASTPLHLNLTSPQLRTSINNRVYDVLASGSCVLTDWRQELSDSFDLDKELLVFHKIEEAVELALEWRQRPEELKKIAQAGQKRILAHHTWSHRMSQAVAQISRHLD